MPLNYLCLRCYSVIGFSPVICPLCDHDKFDTVTHPADITGIEVGGRMLAINSHNGSVVKAWELFKTGGNNESTK